MLPAPTDRGRLAPAPAILGAKRNMVVDIGSEGTIVRPVHDGDLSRFRMGGIALIPVEDAILNRRCGDDVFAPRLPAIGRDAVMRGVHAARRIVVLLPAFVRIRKLAISKHDNRPGDSAPWIGMKINLAKGSPCLS